MENVLSRPDYAPYRITNPAAVHAELDALRNAGARVQLSFPDGRGFLSAFASRDASGHWQLDAPADAVLLERLSRSGHGAWITSQAEGVPYQFSADDAVLSRDGKTVLLPTPLFVLRVQRREAYRVHPTSPYFAQVQLKLPRAPLTALYDISVGGLSAVLTAEDVTAVDAAHAKNGALEARLVLRFHTEEVSIQVRLVPRNRLRMTAPRLGVRMGFSLRVMDPRDEQTLQRFVLRLDQEQAKNRRRG